MKSTHQRSKNNSDNTKKIMIWTFAGIWHVKELYFHNNCWWHMEEWTYKNKKDAENKYNKFFN